MNRRHWDILLFAYSILFLIGMIYLIVTTGALEPCNLTCTDPYWEAGKPYCAKWECVKEVFNGTAG